MFTPSGCKGIVNSKSEFVSKTQKIRKAKFFECLFCCLSKFHKTSSKS